VSAESISARPNQELIRGLSVQGLRWNADADLRLPGEILLRSDDIELLSLRRRFDGYCDIYLNLDPKKSNLKNRPFWPAFFWNVAEYLQLERPGPKQSNSRRGEIIECKIADPSLREVQVFCPDGTVRRVVPFRRRVLLANLPPGVSTIKVGDESYKVAVSPLSVAESTLEKSGEFRREAQKIRQLDESPRIHLYWIALLAALTVLAVHQYQFGIKRGER
ncbi:MAG: hypothetical protein LBM70_06675, partial [Victivallales bacterium]|jgi:hypothetical protein|nr:hypothetical protein [Victivallales bacterium]